jgi:hypothetical protein
LGKERKERVEMGSGKRVKNGGIGRKMGERKRGNKEGKGKSQQGSEETSYCSRSLNEFSQNSRGKSIENEIEYRIL